MTLREKTSLPKIESTRSVDEVPASGGRAVVVTGSFASLLGVAVGKDAT
jgi:hypothetical protein